MANSSPDSRIASHGQLGTVARMIADGSCSVLSLDVFDTVLWRRVPRPTDLFAVLAAHLRSTGQLPAWIGDAAFRRMRIAAEQTARARRESLGREVSLFDIWAAMPATVVEPVGLAELVAAEVRVERAFTVVDLDIAALIGAARDNGIPLVLVSDTYFTEEHLEHLLDRPEIGSLADARVFRSHQHGVDKAHGLWEVVLSDLGRTAGQVLHIGDNPIADIEAAGRLGLRTVHYERVDPEFQQVIEREAETLDSFGPFGELVDPAHGDFGLTTLRARTLGARAASEPTAVETSWRYGAAVLGPVLTGFAEWVAAKAHEAGTPVVWCPMREGELLSVMIDNAARARGWAVRAKPVWLSRHVVSVATLDAEEPEAVREFLRPRHELTVRQLLETLHLLPGDVPELVGSLDEMFDNEHTISTVCAALTGTAHLRNRLAVVVTGARERLVRSLREAGALDGDELTLVDIGWGGTIQLQLSRLLHRVGIDIEPAGLYLATNERCTPVLLAGLRVEGYLGQAGHPREVIAAASRSPEVLEQSINALCGSLIDFTEGGEPVLGPVAGNATQLTERRAVQDGIRAFQENWYRYVATDKNWPLLTTAAPRLAAILTAVLRTPTAREAAVLGNWQHDDNFGSAVVTRLIPRDLVQAIPYLSPNDLDDLHMRDSFWPSLLAASDRKLAAAARAVASGSLDPAVFEPSGKPFETHLRYRARDEVWHDGPRRRVRINHNGLSFARMGFADEGITHVSLAIPGRPALVRVDWIEARVIAGRDRVPKVLRWDDPADFADLTFAECTWLGGNLVEFDFPYSAVWLPLAERAGGTVSSGQVTIGFAMLPQPEPTIGPRLAAAAPRPRVADRLVAQYRTRGPVGVITGAARVAARKLTGER
ncbi:Haloacid dehalogenase-like hydrolase [Actinokineospora terrae]|uniref:Haloacid dehalogenase-like hydrolase n=2 Tax=Actinokineospora terrae TaxID=155974 RepID=A0A1H9LHX6_9PSEU|nr:Haloacid dehalogenase-like hydrolase [Actinokineospora terrae]